MTTSWDYFSRRQRTSFNRRQPALWREWLPLGTAERWPGAARLKMHAHTVVAAVLLQRMSGVAPPRQRTNAGCLHFFCTRKEDAIYEEGVYASRRFRT